MSAERIAASLRGFAEDTLGLEGAFIVAGLLGLTFVAWQLDWLLGIAVAAVMCLVAGIALAKPHAG